MKYEAFISYRHGDIDESVAVQIHKDIEKYRVPGKIAREIGRKRVGRVFRDADELQAASDLSAVIREALDESEWLIVIASKRYQESPWCLEEIEYFIRLRGREKILVILVDGEPEESFPKALTEVERDGEVVHIEPLAVDVRGATEHETLKNLRREQFRFFSSMLGVSYDTLRDRQRERRRRRIGAALGAVFAVLAVVIGVVTVKNIQLNEAYDALDQSNQETLRGESYYLAEYADAAYQRGDTKTATMLALAGLPADLKEPDRPYVADAMRSLTQALGIYDYTAGFHAGLYLDREQETFDARTQLSEDGSLVLLETYTSVAGNMLNREVQVLRTDDGEEVCRYTEAPMSRNYYHAGTMGAVLSSDGEKLYYLGEDGLTGVTLADGKVLFTAEPATELCYKDGFNATVLPDVKETGQKGTAIVTIDYNKGHLYSYDGTGEALIDCELESDLNYTLGKLSPDGARVAIEAHSETAFGVITIELKDGQNSFFQMPGLCSYVRFSADLRLCFLMSDAADGLKHIVQYNMVTGDEGYLCNADWDMQEMTLAVSDSSATCYYYHGNTLTEVDCESKKGKKIWEHVFASEVVSVRAGDGLVAVSCRDGSISVFQEKDKRSIRMPGGNGESVYVMSVTKERITARDYWGRSIRFYQKDDNTGRSASASLSVNGVTAGRIPERWYTCTTDGDRFVLGFHSGAEDTLAVFDGADGKLSAQTSKPMKELGYDTGFDNKTVELRDDCVMIQDYNFYEVRHFGAKKLSEVYRTDENSYYFYREDGSEICVAKDGKLQVLEAATGKKKEETDLPTGYDRGIRLHDRWIFGNDSRIRIVTGTEETILDDAVLFSYNEERELVFYRNRAETRWFVYSLRNGSVLCEGEAGTYSSTIFFGENRYFLNDYSEVYDMNTGEKVLEPGTAGSNVYGVQTTEKLPYFVVWCQEGEADAGGRGSGTNVAYLYEKNGSGEIVGMIPNFVAMMPNGEIIVFDGEQKLYRFPLLTVEEVKKKAEQTVGNWSFSDYQKKEYHLFG